MAERSTSSYPDSRSRRGTSVADRISTAWLVVRRSERDSGGGGGGGAFTGILGQKSFEAKLRRSVRDGSVTGCSSGTAGSVAEPSTLPSGSTIFGKLGLRERTLARREVLQGNDSALDLCGAKERPPTSRLRGQAVSREESSWSGGGSSPSVGERTAPVIGAAAGGMAGGATC